MGHRLSQAAAQCPEREVNRVGDQRQVEPADRGENDPEVPADIGMAREPDESSEGETAPSGR